MENLVNVIEAMIFAAGNAISKKEILDHLPEDVSRKNLNDAIDKLAEKYSGDCGILLQQFEDKVQFCSNDKYGEIVSNALQPVKEKELTKSLMEVLSIIAYYQPIKKSSIEELRGEVAADYAISMLLKADLICVAGYDATPGRPLLDATTDGFLKKFDLRDLSDLPGIEDVKQRMYELGNFNVQKEGLYREEDSDDEPTDAQLQQESEFGEFGDLDNGMPTFLDEEEVEEYSGEESELGELEEIEVEENNNEASSDDINDEMPF